MATKAATSYVWYASYGSNLLKSRFMCYIKGGTPIGSSKREVGCKDKTPPLKDKPITIPHELYFAEHAKRWEEKGVAFIDTKKSTSKRAQTLGRMYLITKEQFEDVVAQENGVRLKIDFKKVISKKSLVLADSWYGNILYLGSEHGEPIFSFTSPKPMSKATFNEPSKKYLRVIAMGLKQTYKMTSHEIFKYLLKKQGV